MRTMPVSAGVVSRRGAGFLLVAAIHVLFVYALVAGLGRAVVEIAQRPIETKLIDDVRDQEDVPPPPPPKFQKPPPAFVPPPDILVEAPAQTNAITQIQKRSDQPALSAASLVVPPKSAGPDGISQPEYPPSSQRLGEEGVVVLALYVLADGTIGDVIVDSSSGFERLDNAALEEARRQWRFEPGTIDGKPAAMWHKFAVRFQVEQ